jgi:hypothetical protein
MTPHQPNKGDGYTGFEDFENGGDFSWALRIKGEIVTMSVPYSTRAEAADALRRLVSYVVDVGEDGPVRGLEDT